MKCKSITLILVAVCLHFLNHAQPKSNHLDIGDKAPDIKPYKWIKGSPITEFKKSQIYLVEFGATWCKPCVEAIPEMTALANDLKGKVTVASIFVMEHNTKPPEEIPDYLRRVQTYVEKMGDAIGYAIAVDDPQKSMEIGWLKAAGKTGIPYAFVIDTSGNIAWIGSSMREARIIIEKILKGTYVANAEIDIKPGATYKSIRDLVEKEPNTIKSISFISNYEQGHAIETGRENIPYIPGLQWVGDGEELAARKNKIQVVGESLRRLYYMAYGDTLWNYPLMMNPANGTYPDTIKWPSQRRSYGKFWYRPILEVKDSSLFESNYRAPENRFNYFLKVPPHIGTAKRMQLKMQHDLFDYFGYDVAVEERMMPCWKLKVSEAAKKKLKTKKQDSVYRMYVDAEGNHRWENAEMRDIIFQLEIKYGYTPFGALIEHPGLQPPFIDDSGLNTKIDYYYPAEFVKKLETQYAGGKNVSFEQFKDMLALQGIELVKSKTRMKVVVIRD